MSITIITSLGNEFDQLPSTTAQWTTREVQLYNFAIKKATWQEWELANLFENEFYSQMPQHLRKLFVQYNISNNWSYAEIIGPQLKVPRKSYCQYTNNVISLISQEIYTYNSITYKEKDELAGIIEHALSYNSNYGFDNLNKTWRLIDYGLCKIDWLRGELRNSSQESTKAHQEIIISIFTKFSEVLYNAINYEIPQTYHHTLIQLQDIIKEILQDPNSQKSYNIFLEKIVLNIRTLPLELLVDDDYRLIINSFISKIEIDSVQMITKHDYPTIEQMKKILPTIQYRLNQALQRKVIN